jgi:hypothetical protein
MTGAIAMSTNKITGLGNPTALQDAATKYYSDISRDTRLAIAGGNMFGNITMTSGGTVKGAVDPTDAQDVATKAYVDNAELLAIAKDISDTAVDVFVYDTSKDSDGGAWRKRTQHTSWYNEAASSTRGSRKEFPAVAVIVAESLQVTIYDGDDPSMPMWMVINADSSVGSGVTATSTSISTGKALFHTAGIKTTESLNGQLILGCGNWQVFNFDFVCDKISFHAQYGSFGEGRAVYSNSIVGRDSAGSYSRVSSVGILPNTINDVAMTVLPNAPIDADTGLPVPTIAVASNGGVSVIKDDGTVVDITISGSTYVYTHNVKFSGNDVVFSNANSAQNYPYVRVVPIPSVDVSYSTTGSGVTEPLYYVGTEAGWVDSLTLVGVDSGSSIKGIEAEGDFRAIGATGGLNLIKEDRTTPSKGLISYITSDYNTGWMNGDIKLATLSDTDTTNVTGAELVTNGTFASDSNWTKGSGWTIGSGVATASSAGHGSGLVQTGASFVGGVTYLVTFTVSNYTTGSLTLYAPRTPTFYRPFLGAAGANGTYAFTYTPTVSSSDIRFEASGTTSLSIDNISIRKAEEDRSVNGNGLQVFGTVTKTAVASGADLVAYSGFSASNYLQQPYNSGLDFGTGEYAFITWFNMPSNGTQKYIAARGTADNAESMRVAVGNNGVYFDYGNGSTYLSTNTAVSSAVWNCLVCTVRAGQLGYVYINGVEQTYSHRAAAPATFLTASDYDLTIGQSHGGAAPWDGSLALFRISATVPSPEQIAKIYNDEKHLFQENAQATLYGASDAVTALAHDDTTDLLHVGTSAGRSVFQGLRRVENTTTAVGAAISASNNLVVEE